MDAVGQIVWGLDRIGFATLRDEALKNVAGGRVSDQGNSLRLEDMSE